MTISLCKTCGNKHGMVIESRENGEVTPVEYCEKCLFTPVEKNEKNRLLGIDLTEEEYKRIQRDILAAIRKKVVK